MFGLQIEQQKFAGSITAVLFTDRSVEVANVSALNEVTSSVY